MRFGMLHLFENPIGKSEREIVREQIDLMVAAEDFGFDSVWGGEHHFTEYGYLASPVVSLAAVAQATKRIRLGTGVVILPMNHPLRVAEDYALLDLMSDGRLDFGVGRGYQPLEFERYGIDQTTTRQRFDECMQIITEAWTNGVVDFHGDYYDFADVPVRPAPLQEPHPPFWMAALSPQTFELAGRKGYHLLLGSVFGLTPKLARERIREYYRGLAAAGHAHTGKKIGCLIQVYVADTMEQARAEFRGPVEWYFHTISKYIAGEKVIKTYETYNTFKNVAQKLDFELLTDHGYVIAGPPDYVVEQLTKAQEIYGMTELLCWTRLGGLDHRKVLRSMELMHQRVFPHLRELAPPPPPQFTAEELGGANSPENSA